MIIAPYDDGTLDLPNWRENFRFAAALAAAIEEKYPGLCRPIFFAAGPTIMPVPTGRCC